MPSAFASRVSVPAIAGAVAEPCPFPLPMIPSGAMRLTRLALLAPALLACARTPTRTAPALDAAWVRPTPAGEMASIYLTIHNPTDSALHLTTVAVEGVPHSTFHESRESAGMAHMADLSELVVPAHDSLQLLPRGLHVMAHGLPRALALRDSIRVTARTSRGALLATYAHVRDD